MKTPIQQLEEKLKTQKEKMEKLEKEVQELKTKEEETGLWFPEDQEKYFFIESYGYVSSTIFCVGNESDSVRIKLGNYYKTTELAEKELEKRKAIQRLKTAWVKDYYFVPDFNSSGNKYFINGWNYTFDKVDCDIWCNTDISKYGLVFGSSKKMSQFIEENAEDLKLVLKNY